MVFQSKEQNKSLTVISQQPDFEGVFKRSFLLVSTSVSTQVAVQLRQLKVIRNVECGDATIITEEMQIAVAEHGPLPAIFLGPVLELFWGGDRPPVRGLVEHEDLAGAGERSMKTIDAHYFLLSSR